MQLRDVWASSDGGRTWIQVCQSAQWEGRQGHAAVVIEDHVYLVGGFGGATRFNDLWKSSDCGMIAIYFLLYLILWLSVSVFTAKIDKFVESNYCQYVIIPFYPLLFPLFTSL